MNDDLEKRLRNLGLHLGARHLPSSALKIKAEPDLKDGITAENALGKYFYLQKNYGLDYAHGDIAFADAFRREAGFTLPGIDKQILVSNCVFLDTETTGLALSAGTFAFMVGVAKITASGLLLRQYFLKTPSEEAAMLLDLSNFIASEDTIVTYNGIGFDIPILKHRYILQKIPVDFERYTQLDLLKYSRALWRFQLESRSLKSVEKHILNFQRNSDEVPGWMAPEIYREFLKTGNMSGILGVFYHNAIDVVSLYSLMIAYINLITERSETATRFETLNYALAKLHESTRNTELSIEYYQIALEQSDLPDNLRINALNGLSSIYKRSGNLDTAIALLKKASELNHIHSIIALAKHYEHREKNFEEALYWVELGISITDPNDPFLLEELAHRKKRVLKKWRLYG